MAGPGPLDPTIASAAQGAASQARPTSTPSGPVQTTATDPLFFPETGFRVAPGSIADFFTRHGGATTFGAPISNGFLLLGQTTQLFRFHALEQRPDGTVGTVALLDLGMVPSLNLGTRTVPPRDTSLVQQAPNRSASDFSTRARVFVETNAPDTWEGQPVGFQRAFLATVNGSPSATELALEVWGLPVSRPTRDLPAPELVYLRWERGVMESDTLTGKIQPLPLGELFKAVLTGQGLPTPLADAARGSRFFQQVAPGLPDGLARPAELPNSSLAQAFVAIGGPVGGPAVISASPSGTPTSTPPATATPTPGADICWGDERISFSPISPRAGDELLIAVSSAHPHPYGRLAGTERTTFVRDRLGQLGRVWEWTVDLTYPGDQTYIFYVDSTIPCVEASIRVGRGLATATPRPSDPFGDNGNNNSSDNSNGNRSDNDNVAPTPTTTPSA